MTATQAQAAANRATAEKQDCGPEDAIDAETDDLAGSGAAAQQQAKQIGTAWEQPNAELLQSESDGISLAEHAADVAQGCQRRDHKHDSLAAAEILIMEDAAELTCDRAAVILRQLSCECQAAESRARRPEASCSISAADEEQQHAALNQVETDCRSAACRTDAKSSAAALVVPARAQMLLDQPDRPGEQVMLLDKAETTDGGHAEQVLEVQQGQINVSGSNVHAAGVPREPGSAMPLPRGHASISRHKSSASLSAATWQANPGRGVSHDTASPSMEQGLDSPPAFADQAPSQQAMPSSSFLQRLQMSKHAAAGGLNATQHQAEDSRQGEQLTCAVHLAFQASLALLDSGLVLLCLHGMQSFSNTGAVRQGAARFGNLL